MDISIQFKKGALELCVLVLIYQQDRYGYELAQSVSEHIEIAEGALYPLLRRLVNEGYCTTYLQESTGGPPRKYYRITPSGKSHMKLLVIEWRKFTDGVSRLIERGTDL
ncbi:PadR family transcriptional regulator [Paenibacillus sp. CAA11]|uniref:PadR family transcriptional regulator n=1 Tax=Paenibacillus sp. CAA11 TaxID=1532905 RepID=UPI000D384299|nr:PadR family transcriptional regulator [Paenibacillus sp. CAA11]AWB46332.1 PadR family transcriptional regulator [Paenibacillus sp. CAA11]